MEQSNSTTNIDLSYQANELDQFLSSLKQEELNSPMSNEESPPSTPNPTSTPTSSPTQSIKSEKGSRKRSRTAIESSPDDDDGGQPSEKKARRRLQNRVAAQNSRLRKKQHVDELEGKNTVLQEENTRLNNTVQNLSSENEKLRQQLIDLHKQLNNKEEEVVVVSPMTQISSNVVEVSNSIDHFTPIESAALNRNYSPQMERGVVKKVHLTPRSAASFIQLTRMIRLSMRTMSTFLVTLLCLWGWKIYTTQPISQFSALLQLIYGKEQQEQHTDRDNSVNTFFESVIPTRTVDFYFRRKRKRRKKLRQIQTHNTKLYHFVPPILLLPPGTQPLLSLQPQDEKFSLMVNNYYVLQTMYSIALSNVTFYAFTILCTNNRIPSVLESTTPQNASQLKYKLEIDQYSLTVQNINHNPLLSVL